MTARGVAALIARELVGRGARAVVLMGSHARGDALRHSDIDLIALGDGPAYRLEMRDDYLIATSWTTPAAVERAILTPSQAGLVVQGWRDALPLIDPDGAAAALRHRASEWRWSNIPSSALDDYVAEELTGLAEEVQKLVNLLNAGNASGAAVQRNLLSIRLGAIMAVHLRLLYSTENDLWNLISEALDEGWQDAQSRAFGLDDEHFVETCRAAAELYRRATEHVCRLLDDRQRAVVAAACTLQAEVWQRE